MPTNAKAGEKRKLMLTVGATPCYRHPPSQGDLDLPLEAHKKLASSQINPVPASFASNQRASKGKYEGRYHKEIFGCLDLAPVRMH